MMTVSFIAIENFIFTKYVGKPSFTNSILEEANTKQLEAGHKDEVQYQSIEEIDAAQRFSQNRLYDEYYDFRYISMLYIELLTVDFQV